MQLKARLQSFVEGLSPSTLKRLIVLGFALRLLVIAVSNGSPDIRLWERYGGHIAQHGLIQEYLTNPQFNHPPLMGWWSLLATHLAAFTGLPFAYTFKLLPFLGDVVGTFALMKYLAARGEDRIHCLRAAAIFSLSLVAIWSTGFHGNTDSIMAVLTFVAVAVVDRRDRPFLAGLMFAAALNIKLIPLMLLPAMFIMQATSWKKLALALLGGAVGLLPFLFPLTQCFHAFYTNAVDYQPVPNRWGIHLLLSWLADLRGTAMNIPGLFPDLDAKWSELGRYVIMVLSIAIGLWGRWRKRSPLEVGALVTSMFLVLTPGLGIQYLVFVVPTLIAFDLKRGFLYSLTAGIMLSCIYLDVKEGVWPLQSTHHLPYRLHVAALSIIPWLVLCELLARSLVPDAVVVALKRINGFLFSFDSPEPTPP